MGKEQVISSFSGITIDMDHSLCVPSIHAIYDKESAVIDVGGGIREKSSGFPDAKIELLRQWISKHKEEIVRNHHKRGYNEYPLDPIDPE